MALETLGPNSHRTFQKLARWERRLHIHFASWPFLATFQAQKKFLSFRHVSWYYLNHCM